MLLSCSLDHRWISTLHKGLHKAVSSHQGQECIPPHQPSPYTPIMHKSPWLPDIQTFFLSAVLHSINPPLPRLTLWATTSTLSHIDPLSNLVLFHSLHMAEPSKNTINLFIHTLHHFTQLPYPCIWDFIHSPDTQQTSQVVHLCRPNSRFLLLPLYNSHYHT